MPNENTSPRDLSPGRTRAVEDAARRPPSKAAFRHAKDAALDKQALDFWFEVSGSSMAESRGGNRSLAIAH